MALQRQAAGAQGDSSVRADPAADPAAVPAAVPAVLRARNQEAQGEALVVRVTEVLHHLERDQEAAARRVAQQAPVEVAAVLRARLDQEAVAVVQNHRDREVAAPAVHQLPASVRQAGAPGPTLASNRNPLACRS